MKLVFLAAYSLLILDVYVQLAVHQNVKCVTSPAALTDDLFARVVDEQAGIRADPLVGIGPAVDDYFEVQFILVMAFVFFEQSSDDVARTDGFYNYVVVFDFAGHSASFFLKKGL